MRLRPRGGHAAARITDDRAAGTDRRSLPPIPARRAGHIVTGPIAIAGAMPGDMLEIRIEKIVAGANWGYNVIRPLAGTLPEDFHETTMMHIPVDQEKLVCTLPWGTELKLAPFFGVMGVAPPPAFGRIMSKEPRIHGGNLDNKEMTAGSTLFLPVWVPGANFSVGDGHGVQGDGEVCVTALEMCLTGTFTFILHKGDGPNRPLLRMPRAETRDPFHQHGPERGSGPGDEAGAAGDDRVHLHAQQPVAGAGLCILLAGGGFPRDADGERRKRRARAAEKGPAVLIHETAWAAHEAVADAQPGHAWS